MYNEYYAYIPYLITTYTHLGFSMDRYANKYVTEVREVNFKLKHLSDPGKPINIPGTGDIFLTQNNVIWEPEQSKYVNALQIFHDNPADLPDSYVFVPSLRRSIRLTTAARCSPLVGSDYTQDDERSMNLQPPIFQAKFLGYKKILVGYPEPGYHQRRQLLQAALLRGSQGGQMANPAGRRPGHEAGALQGRRILLWQPNGVHRQGNLAADLDGSV